MKVRLVFRRLHWVISFVYKIHTIEDIRSSDDVVSLGV